MSVKSLICPFEGNSSEFDRALTEVDNFSKAENLDGRYADKLRLVSEEVIGMASNILNIENGRFWIEKEEEGYVVCFSCEAEIGDRAKAIFDSTSQNIEYKGIAGLFRKVVDQIADAFAVSGSVPEGELFEMAPNYTGIELIEPEAYEWSLQKYEERCELNDKAELWDELELSIIKKMSDNILIFYRNKKLSLRVYVK